MSYSFSITAADKDEASKKVAEELAKVCESQPTHAKDREAAQAAVDAFVALLPAPVEGQQFYINVNGSLGWNGDGNDRVFTSASISVNASVAAKPAEV